MEYVNFGKAGVKVSKIALGLGFRGQRDPAEAQKVVEHALDLGITFFDCANVYGPTAETHGTSATRRGFWVGRSRAVATTWSSRPKWPVRWARARTRADYRVTTSCNRRSVL